MPQTHVQEWSILDSSAITYRELFTPRVPCRSSAICPNVTRLATSSSADRFQGAVPHGNVLLARQGKLPMRKLQKSSQLAVLLLKSLDPVPQRRHYVLPKRARRSRDADAAGAASVMVLRDRVIRPLG